MENKWGMYMKTSISEKIAYGMGDVACNVVYALTSGLIVYFYTNVIGVSAGVVGTILLVSRVFDGVSDLLIAQLMDKINSRHGRAVCGFSYGTICSPIACGQNGTGNLYLCYL